MKQRYNFALITNDYQKYIDFAQNHFSTVAHNYLLGTNSLPHITVCQFYTSPDIVPKLIAEIPGVDKEIPIDFRGICFTKKSDPNLWGASLLVDRSKDLLLVLDTIACILQQYDIEPINKIDEMYFPHLSLAQVTNTSLSNISQEILETNYFSIALGESDDEGQLTAIIAHKT